MKKIVLILTIFISVNIMAQIPEIVQFKLNPGIAHTVYCFEKNTGVTTVMFPGAISSISGARVAVKFDEKNPLPYLIHYTEGNNYFTVKSLATAGKDNAGAVNVIYNGHIYVVHLKTVKKAHSSVTFVLPKQPKIVSGGIGNYKKPAGVNPRVLVGLLDKSKSYHLFKKNYPSQVEGLGYYLANKIMDYSTHKILLKEVIRYDDKDTLVFHIQMKNKTASELRYNPRDFAVNVGSKIYYSSISDASGMIPGEGVSSAYFAITGNKHGGLNHLSAENDWKILLPISQMPKILPSENDPVKVRQKKEKETVKVPVIEVLPQTKIKKVEKPKEVKKQKKIIKVIPISPTQDSELPTLKTLPDMKDETKKTVEEGKK